MEAISKWALSAIRLMLGILLITSVALICANATGRYVFLEPIIWAEEILGYVLVWTVYLGGVLVTWDGGHLKMDLLSRTLPTVPRKAVNGLATGVFVLIGSLIVYQSLQAMPELTHLSQVAEVPMDVMHSVIPISFVLITALILVRLRGYLAGTLESDAEQLETLRASAASAEMTAGDSDEESGME